MARYHLATPLKSLEDDIHDYLASDESFQKAKPYEIPNPSYSKPSYCPPLPSQGSSYVAAESPALCSSFTSLSSGFSPRTASSTRLEFQQLTKPLKLIGKTEILVNGRTGRRSSLRVPLRPTHIRVHPMASIVYDGVAGNGTLFQGQKFFIAQRVPSRHRFVESVKNNGGLIVTLENNADILIADHARPTVAPPNSFSWTYIDESLKNGVLEDLEKHRISTATRSPRPIGSNTPTKSTRTPFSQADDNQLRIWVTKAELNGLSTKGNEIYQQLAAINPRHTYQSWRDRWVKYLSYQPRPDVSMDNSSGPVKASKNSFPQSRYAHTAAPSSSVTQAQASAAPGNISTPTKQTIPKRLAVSAARSPPENIPFTAEDEEILEKEYCDIERLDEAQLVDAWNRFADHYGRHTASEWCKYYHDIFKPQKEKEKEKEEEEKKAKKAKRKAKAMEVVLSDTESPKPRPHTTPIAPTSTTLPILIPSREEAERIVISKLSPKNARFIEPPGSSVSVEKAKFLEDLRSLARFRKLQIEPQVDVGGLNVQLYDLWNAVNKPEFGGFDNVDKSERWLQVAIKLDINTYTHTTAPAALRKIYHDVLINLDTFRGVKKIQDAERAKERPAAASISIEQPASAKILGKPSDLSENITTSVKPPARTFPPLEIAADVNNTIKDEQSFLAEEERFLADVTWFAKEKLRIDVEQEPIVCGRRIDIVHLRDLVNGLGGFDRVEATDRWKEVAFKLGYHRQRNPLASLELSRFYEYFLADYDEFCEEREKARREIGEVAFEDEEPDEDMDDDLDRPSSLPKPALSNSQKRARLEQVSMVKSTFTPNLNHNKRLRIDKVKGKEVEIPSTPEHVYNSSLAAQQKLLHLQELEEHEDEEVETAVFDTPTKRSQFAKKATTRGKVTLAEPETQDFQFSFPSSPSQQLWAEAMFSVSPEAQPHVPAQPQVEPDHNAEMQSQPDSQHNEEELETFFARCAELGYSEEVVTKALQCTTMEAELAQGLLEVLTSDGQVPDDVAGVWTSEDDIHLKDAVKGWKRMVRKHGVDRCTARKNFLRDLEEAEREVSGD